MPEQTGQRRTRQTPAQSQERPRTTATGRLNAIRQRRIQSRRMMVGISFVVIAFCIVVGVQMIQKHNTLKKLQEQESKLTEQYEQELELSKELKDQESYVKTDDYVEEMARRLGLLYPDEVIFKPEE
ncbi:MAG: FtsB family cell division protein [Eubacterium sp.]